MESEKSYVAQRYQDDILFRRRMLELVKKYNNSEKGKAKRKAWVQKKLGEDPCYFSRRFKQRRLDAKENGKCTSCFENDSTPGFSSCEECRNKINDKRKLRLKQCKTKS